MIVLSLYVKVPNFLDRRFVIPESYRSAGLLDRMVAWRC